MNGNLLDTNIVIALLKKEKTIEGNFRNVASIFVPSIVIGELNFGARKSILVDSNLAVIQAFAQQNVILSCDSETSDFYGRIKFLLQKKGKLMR